VGLKNKTNVEMAARGGVPAVGGAPRCLNPSPSPLFFPTVLVPLSAFMFLSVKWAQGSCLPVSSLGPEQPVQEGSPSWPCARMSCKGSFIQQTIIDFPLCARQGAGVLDTGRGPSQSGGRDRCANKCTSRQSVIRAGMAGSTFVIPG
jgi:hypothetical protein